MKKILEFLKNLFKESQLTFLGKIAISKTTYQAYFSLIFIVSWSKNQKVSSTFTSSAQIRMNK